MFSGVTHLSLDLKNRISIPSKYREIFSVDFNNRITITLESYQCLLLYPEQNWLHVREKFQKLSTTSHPLVKSYQRLLLGYANTVEIDKTGRILLPNSLKDMVNLNHEVVLVGLDNRFELWNKQAWHEETNKALQSSPLELAELLNGFSL